jgi:predicted transcriptional regulator of viral defense system
MVLREKYGDEGKAFILERVAKEIEQAVIAEVSEVVTIQEAHEICGYQPDTLRKMIVQGKLHNAGRVGAPRLRVSELPKRRNSQRVTSAAPLRLHQSSAYTDGARAVVDKLIAEGANHDG